MAGVVARLASIGHPQFPASTAPIPSAAAPSEACFRPSPSFNDSSQSHRRRRSTLRHRHRVQLTGAARPRRSRPVVEDFLHHRSADPVSLFLVFRTRRPNHHFRCSHRTWFVSNSQSVVRILDVSRLRSNISSFVLTKYRSDHSIRAIRGGSPGEVEVARAILPDHRSTRWALHNLATFM